MILYLSISEMHAGLPAVREKYFSRPGLKVKELCEKLGAIFGYGKVRQKFGDIVMNAHNKSIVLLSQSGRESGRAGGQLGGCQICGTHISVTAWRIFSVQSAMEFSRPLVVQRHGHLTICPIWGCPWAKNLSNLAQIGSRLCRMHISETAGWIYSI